jgi:outer membrane protein assembly factor BamB
MRKLFVLMSLSITLILSISAISASAQSPTYVNWNSNANYGLNWNYVSQSVLNSSNAQSLAIKWVLPLPAAAAPYKLNAIADTPIIENGIAYMFSTTATLYAVDTQDGSVLWSFQAPYSPASSGLNAGIYHGHNSDLFYSTELLGQPLVWFLYEGNGYHIYALAADTGHLVVNYTLPTNNLPGVRGIYQYTGRDAILDQKNGVLIIGTGSISEGTGIARGFFIGINVKTNPPQVMWETPVMPPQDGSDPNWDLQSIQSMQYAWIFNGTGAVNLKSLPLSVLNQTFYDDWGLTKYYNGTNSFAGTSTGWGGPWAVDPSTGVAYVTTDQASPDWNATFRPGPDLWSDSIFAINETNGQPIWAFQTTPHDLWDFDCSWSVLLVNATLSNGQTQPEVLKGCKNGYFYALDPNTGKLLWYFDPPNIVRENTYIANIFNETQMTKPWECYPAASCYQNPSGTGGFESDPSYNPNTGLVYVAAYNSGSKVAIQPVAPTPGVPYDTAGLNFAAGGAAGAPVYNTTIWALNAATGKPAWSLFIPNQGYRGGTTTTGNLLFVPLTNGTIDVINAATGTVVAQPFIGAGMDTQPAVGTDPNGNIVIIQPVGSAGGLGLFTPLVSGTVVALHILPSAPVVTTKTVSGVSPTIFYGVVAIAVVLAIVALAIGLASRRRGPPKSSS